MNKLSENQKYIMVQFAKHFSSEQELQILEDLENSTLISKNDDATILEFEIAKIMSVQIKPTFYILLKV